MVNYDSDSEDEDLTQYTETNVLLGYVSPDASPDDISYIGGTPQWIDPSVPASAALARCKICHDIMVLLLQLNGELPEFPGHDRRLYVFACRRKTCQRMEGSIRSVRGVRINQLSARDQAREEAKLAPKQVEKPASNAPSVVKSTGLGESLFGAKPAGATTNAGMNPFSTGAVKAINPFSSPTGTQNNPFASPSAFPSLSTLAAKPSQTPDAEITQLPKTFASALSLGNNTTTSKSTFGPPPPTEPWPTTLPPPYPILYFDAVEREQLDDPEEDTTIPPVTMDLDEDPSTTSSSSAPQKEDKDTYESSIDKEFQAFADRLSQNPEQVIRYEFGGQPLLYTKSDAVGKLLAPPSSNKNAKVTTTTTTTGSGYASRIPRCRNCGAARCFEVQMTPHAILELEGEDVLLDGMEWGTIIVGVCEADCVVSGTGVGESCYLEEWTGVQWEEKMERR